MLDMLFWPFMLISVILSFIGLLFFKYQCFYFAAVLILPMSLYVAALTRYHLLALTFPILFWGAGVLTKNRTPRLSLFVCLPNYVFIGWLTFVIMGS